MDKGTRPGAQESATTEKVIIEEEEQLLDPLSMDPHLSGMVVLSDPEEVGADQDVAIGAATRAGHVAVAHVTKQPATPRTPGPENNLG